MDEARVAQHEVFPGLEPVAPVLRLVAGEVAQTEGIGREEAVGADVPRRGVAEARGMVHDGDPEFGSVEGPGVVDPVGGLAPAALFAHGSARVRDRAAVLLLERRGETDPAAPLLGVAGHDGPFGRPETDPGTADAAPPG